ncbi:MAG TPA: hypothetical protein DCF33_17835 [Saprospirales bacterium]|nr:hypothetical protein [Saprospirales bacterium]
MKNIMRKPLQLTLILAFAFLVQSATAQKDWRWDGHGVGFSAPANMRITQNTDSEFAAEGSDLILSIYVEQDGEVTKETLADALLVAAKEFEYDEISDADELQIDDFEGYYVEGTKDGVGAFIITLLDKKSSTNLVVVIAFTTDGARDKAIDIADSFYAFD